MSYSVGDLALDRDGRTVKIVRIVHEDGTAFAWVTYPNGDGPSQVGGRVAGTEDAPIWEHRVKSGEVCGGDYYNPADWYIEKGLRRLPVSERTAS